MQLLDPEKWIKIFKIDECTNNFVVDCIDFTQNIIFLDINALGSTKLKHCSSIKEEGGILVDQKLHHSTYDLIIVFKMTSTLVGFEFRKWEEVSWSKVWWVMSLGLCYIEECADTDSCGFDHGSPANKHNCWNGLCYWSHVTRNGGYINRWDRSLG